jgi:hypothetical protein
MTKWQLFNLLSQVCPMPGYFVASDGKQYLGILQSVQREDGSGSSFNITIANQSGTITIHIRTTD